MQEQEKDNYYEILYKLNQIQNKIRDFNNDLSKKLENIQYQTNKPILDYDNYLSLILETKSLIFEYDVLRNKYLDKIKDFKKAYNTPTYREVANDFYDKIKNILEKYHNNKYTIKYSKVGNDENPIIETNFFNKKREICSHYDYPLLYFYQSILSLIDYTKIGIIPYVSIKEFYIDIFYSNINLSKQQKQFDYIQKTFMKIPNNLAYYIMGCCIPSYHRFFSPVIADFFLVSTVEVLKDLELFIYNNIEQHYGLEQDNTLEQKLATQKTNLSETEIKILQERKYNHSTQIEIMEALGIHGGRTNMTNKIAVIKYKLNANNIDEAIRIYEKLNQQEL